jgi:hypothetical protein
MRTITTGVVLIIVGIAIFAFTLFKLIGGAALDEQTKVPGSVSAVLDAPGRYYVWDNHWTRFEGQRVRYAAGWPAETKVVVRDSNGVELAFVADASQNWSIGNNEKTSVGYVEVPAATTIQIDISGVMSERIVTVSNLTMKQELWSRLGGFGIALVTGAIGIVLCLFGLLVRRRAVKAGNSSQPENIGG